jgi:hypothetical protein
VNVTDACPQCGASVRATAAFCRTCGHALAKAGSSPATPTQRQAPPLESDPEPVPGPVPKLATDPDEAAGPDVPAMRRRLRRRVLLVAGVVVALLAATGVVALIEDTLYSPDGTVTKLFDALARRDGPAARALGGCENSPVCGPDGLGTGYTPPTDLRITAVEYGRAAKDDPTRRPDNNRAIVRVQYRLAGATHQDAVGLQRLGGGFFRDWSIVKPAGWRLTLDSAQVEQARVAGVVTATTKARTEGAGVVFAVPGGYQVAGVPDALFDTRQLSLTVAGPDPGGTTRLPASPKPTALGEVEKQVRQHLDGCAAQAVLRPRLGTGLDSINSCPFSANVRYTIIRDIRWTVANYPELSLEGGDGKAVSVNTTKPGTVTVALEWSTDVLEPRDWNPYTESIHFKVGGRVLTDAAGKITWTP